MKKLIKYFSLLMIPLAFVLLVSCTAKVVPTYETAWTYDEFVHYHKGEGDFANLKSEEANHNFSDWTVTKAATYEESGMQERSCTVCGYKQTEAIPVLEKTVVYSKEWKHDATYHWHEAVDDPTDIINHDFHDFDLTVTEATCTEDGFTTFVCKTCGYSFRANYIETLGHTYDRFEMIIEPTEETIGYASLICSRDNHKLALTLPVLSETDYTVTTVASTCSTNGTKTYTYKANSLATITKQLPKTEHKFGDWAVDVEATETTDGLKHHTCLVCGEVEEATVYATSHTHTFGEDWVYDENNPEIGHYHQATCEHTEVLGDLEDHTFEVKSTVPATCTTTGYTVYECSKCGYEYKGAFTSMLGHTYENFEVTKAPTKTTTGLAKATCTVCNDLSEIFLPALTKDNYDIVETAGTCTTKGNIVYTLKTNSAIKITEELDTELGEHDYQFKETVAPTCTERGYSVYECSRCHETENSDYVDALGHNYSFSTFNWDETNYSVTATYKCSVCHDEDIRDVASTYITNEYSESTDGTKCILTYTVNYDNHTDSISKELEHEYGEWIITAQATTTSTGLKERTCAHCGHNETQVIPVKGNNDDLIKSGIYVGNYYNSITSSILANADTLRDTLTELVNENYKRYSYSGESGTVGKLKIVDSYDLDYVECIYTGQRIEKSNSSSNTGAWNKEHVWAKSHGFNDEKYDAYSDMHHLRVSEANINSKRSNSYFDEVSSPTSTDIYGNKWTTSVFEPRDEVKGDIARMLFYMTVKYNGTSSPDGLNLVLVLSNNPSEIYSATNTGDGTYGGTHYLGILNTLIKWHFEDPVDEREIFRNNEIFKLQNNRNPFIDHPEYVYYLYQDEAEKYVTDITSLDKYVSSNAVAIASLEEEIESIGTVTLDKKDTILDALNKYDALGQVSKSFFKKYRLLMSMKDELERLESQANQDTSVATLISFVGASNTTGTVVNNGISVSYVAAGNNATYGIFAQGTSQGTNPARLTVTGGYSGIIKVKFTWSTNLSGGTTADVTISDGTNKVTATSEQIPNSTTKTSSFTVDVSSLDFTKTITITVKNNGKSSVRIKEITFEVN